MPKQNELPGVERTSIPEIDTAAEEYVKIRDKRMGLTEKEVVAKTNLVQVVLANQKLLTPNDHGELIYRFDDLLVILKSGKPKVKVKLAHDDPDEDSDED